MLRIFPLFTFLLSAVLIPLQTQAATPNNESPQWEEGKHFEIVGNQMNPRLGIVEVFSYWCPHCYSYESIVSNLKSKLPQNTQLTKAHVDFMNGSSRVIQQEATKVMLIARAINREEAFNSAMFKAIHQDKTRFSTTTALKKVLLEKGVNGEKFDKLSESFGMKSRINRNYKLTKGIKEVPTFIVNGKYKPKFTRGMTPDEFIKLILWLNKQP